MKKIILTESQRAQIIQIRGDMRKIATGITQHSFWEWISDLDTLVAGREPRLNMSADAYIECCQKELEKAKETI